MKTNSASIWIDDAFTPKHMKFQECDSEIEFFIDGESIRVQVYDMRGKTRDEKFKMGMRIPLYAQTALAQMFTQTLNGQRLLSPRNEGGK